MKIISIPDIGSFLPSKIVHAMHSEPQRSESSFLSLQGFCPSAPVHFIGKQPMALTASTSPLFIPSLQTLLISCVCPLFPLPPPLLPVFFPEAACASARKPSCTSPQDRTAWSCLSVFFSLGSPTGPFLEFLCPPCHHVHQYTHTGTHMHTHPHLQSPPHMLISSHIDTIIYTASTTHKHTHIHPNPQHKHPHIWHIYTHLHTHRHTIYPTHRHPPTSIFYPHTPIPTSFPFIDIFSHIHTYIHAYLLPTHRTFFHTDTIMH